MKKSITLCLLLLTASLTGMVAAVEYEEAVVVAVEPVYHTVRVNEPREECWRENVRHRRQHHGALSSTRQILGAIIGGAIGNAVGHKKRNKQVGAVTGAILGASIARDSDRHHRHDDAYNHGEQRCRIVYDQYRREEVASYRVSYEYNGVIYHTHMKERPSETITVKIAVSPVAY